MYMNASHFSPLFFVLHLTLSLTLISHGHDSLLDLTNLKKKQKEQKIRSSFKKKKPTSSTSRKFKTWHP